MTGRTRLLTVVALLAAGSLGLIAGTQTWVRAELADGATAPLAVAGAATVPVWSPLCLALLAVGAMLSIAGPVLRYVGGALALAVAGSMAVTVTPIISGPPVDSVAAAVADSTGISGLAALSELVAGLTLTAWPLVGAAAAVIGIAAAVLVLTTARRWPDSGRRYRSPIEAGSSTSADPVDSWDALSQGADPTGADPAR